MNAETLSINLKRLLWKCISHPIFSLEEEAGTENRESCFFHNRLIEDSVSLHLILRAALEEASFPTGI